MGGQVEELCSLLKFGFVGLFCTFSGRLIADHCVSSDSIVKQLDIFKHNARRVFTRRRTVMFNVASSRFSTHKKTLHRRVVHTISFELVGFHAVLKHAECLLIDLSVK